MQEYTFNKKYNKTKLPFGFTSEHSINTLRPYAPVRAIKRSSLCYLKTHLFIDKSEHTHVHESGKAIRDIRFVTLILFQACHEQFYY